MQRKIPSAITNITLNRATFTDVPIEDLTFINFFYGNNGAGKSSIAHAIDEDEGIEWADGKTRDDYDVLVYNQDFINDNFMNYDNLKGVFIFGEEDIEAKKKIDELTELKKQKSDARQDALDEYEKKTAGKTSALKQFEATCFTKTAAIRKRFEKCMVGKKQKKNFAEAVLAETKPTEHDLAELERIYDVAFDDSARAYSEFKKAATTTYGNLPGKDLLDKTIVSSSDTPFAKFIKALGETASDWVRVGHTHYAGTAGGKCPYCQQKLPANFETDIAATFDAQYQQDIRDLGRFQDTYSRETDGILRVLQANTSDVMPSIDLKAYQEKLALLESNFEINRQRIAEKVKEPSKTISLEDTDTLLLEIGAMIDDINKSIQANNDVVSAKRSSKAKCKTEIMQYLAFILAADVQSYQDEIARLQKEIDDITEHGKKLRKEIGDLTTQISDLNKHNANTEAAIDSINKILRESGFQGFSIRAKTGVENVYEVIREDGSVADNLSEGERNFIAFLYFYHQVRGSMNSEELKEKIVVIDDPVSSMDSTALFLVSAIVREMITLKKVINNPGTLETTRSIANQMQMKQIQDTLKGIQEMQSYQLDRDRDRDILTPFFDARDYILQAQNAKSIESRNQFLEKASDRMTTALNSVYAEMRTASLHLAKNTKWALFHKQSSIDTLLANLSDDLQLATKFSGVQMQVFEALGRREDSKLVLDRYQTVMHDFITQEIGGRGMSALELMHDNYHYTKDNTDCWYRFSKELEPALESTRLAIENKDVYIVSLEDVNNEQE